MKHLRSTKLNLLVTGLVAIACFAILHSTDALEGTGMAALLLNWLPLAIGIFAALVYLVVNIFTKKHSWIATLLGNALNVWVLLGMIFAS